MSIIVRPGTPAPQSGRLGIGLALAAAEAVARDAACPVGLKWPNDVLLEGRKVGGVLVETEAEGGRITGAVLSLGLNVNIAVADLPREVRAQATSLREVTGRCHSLARLAAEAGTERIEALFPAVDWFRKAWEARGCEVHPVKVYEKGL